MPMRMLCFQLINVFPVTVARLTDDRAAINAQTATAKHFLRDIALR